jgi:flagellar biosynthesis/type III secretory pathway M-ring protein FliF/YscJ
VENLSFQTAAPEPLASPTKLERWRILLQEWSGALRYAGIALLFLVVYFLILRPVRKQALAAFRELPERVAAAGRGLMAGNSVAGEALAGTPLLAGDLPGATDENRRATQLKKQLTDKMKSEPEAASRLLQNWMKDRSQK